MDLKEQTWLSRFNEEYYNNTLNKNWTKNLHYKAQKKPIFDATNARNRDLYNKRYKMDDADYKIMDNYDTEYTSPEHALISFLDKEKQVKEFMKACLRAGTPLEFANELVKVVFDINI